MIKKFFKNPTYLLALLTLLTLGGSLLFAAPPDSPYGPGDTLDPTCAPGDANCSVTPGADLSARDSDDLEEGAVNLYYTAARVSGHVDVLANTGARHSPVSLSGSNYLSLSGQELTAGEIDISSHTNLATGSGLLLTDDTLSVSGLTTTNFTSTNVSQWTNDSGYISSYIETDPVFAASSASGIGAGDITNWDAAYAWGNHALMGYYGSGRKPFLKAVSSTEENFGSTTAGGAGNTTLSTPRRVWLESNQDTTLGSVGIRAETGHFDSQGSRTYRLRIYDSAGAGDVGALLYEESFARSFPVGWDVREIDLPLTTPLDISVDDIFVVEVVITNPTSQNPDSWTSLVLTPQLGTYADALDFDGVPINWYIGFGAAEKGVVGPLDEADLPGYALSTEGQVLARTASGAGFVNVSTGNFASSNISQWTNDANYISDLSTFDATDLSIIDTNSYFTATTVEAALAELFASDSNAFSLLNKPRLSDLLGDVMTYGGFDSYSSIETDEYTSGGLSNDSGMQWHVRADEDVLIEEVAVVANKYGNTDPDVQLLIYESLDEVAPLTLDTLLVDQTRDLFVEDNQTTPTTFVLDEPLQMVAGKNYVIYVRIQNSDYPFFKGYKTGTTSAQQDMGSVTVLKSYRTRYNETITDSGSFYLELQNGFESKGVVGPIDPADLANYSSASSNTFLRKTDNGLEFTAFPGDQQLLLSSSPLGTAVGAGSLYINPSTLSSAEPVAWARNGGWDLPDMGTNAGPAFADLDGDGDLDVMIGDYNTGISYAFENTGNNLSPTWVTKSEWNAPDVGERAKPTFADIDNDGDYDLFIGARNDLDSPASNVYAFENTGTSSSPIWVSKPEWTVATGQSPDPTFADIDNDGDYDLLVGSFVIEMEVYRNTGTNSSPVWTRDASLDIDDGRYFGSPNLNDVDNDGDLDVILSTKGGGCDGDLRGYENGGTATAPIWIRNTSWDLGIVFSCYISASLADVDSDGDADLFVGTPAGNTVAYENVGSTFGTENNTLFGVAVGGNEKFRINGSGDIFGASNLTIDDGSLLVVGTHGGGSGITVTGAGTRMFFDVNKSAFRAGRAASSEWDSANVGDYSVAFGNDNLASGAFSSAFGFNTSATGAYSASFGEDSVASGNYGTVFGQGSTASGNYGTAFGLYSTASGLLSFAAGDGSVAQAGYSTVFGRFNEISGTPGSWVSTEPLFVIGNGANGLSRSNAFTVLKDGNVGLGSSLYLNWGTDFGSGGYGLRDNAGTMEFKDSGGDWTAFDAAGSSAYLSLSDTPETFTSNAIPFINSSGNALVHSSSLTFDENRLSVLGIPSGVTVSDGIFYLNAPQLTGDSVVAWEAEPAWDLATIGSDSHPALVDVDGDGDLDLMTGGANVVGYENTGTNISPVWTRNAGWDIPDTGYLHDAPAFADIDNDGDFDVYIGHGDNNSIRAYENTGTASAPVWTRRAGWDVPGSISINYAKYTRPTFADLDNDGDFDIMYGRSDGAIQTYENTGTISSPAWTIRNEWSPPNVGGSSAPFLYDFDNDGDFDVLIGTGGTTPRAYAYENTGTVTYPEWTAKPEWDTPSPGSYIVAPAVADLDNDGDGDVLLGLSNGTTKGYANIGALGSGENNTLFGIAVGGNERLRLSGNGDLSVFGDMHSTGFINTSTEEAKDDITFLSLERGRNILNDIRTLDIANYRYLSDETGEPLRLGLIAERSPREILSRDGKGVDLYKLSTFTLAGLKSLTENVDRIENALLINGVSLGSDDALVVEGEEQNPLVRALQKLGLVVNDGILSLKKLMGQEVQTEKLCVGETCVTEKELVELLKNSRVEPYSEETVEDNESSILEEENKEFVEEVAKEEVETETGLTEETSITEELQSETEESGGEMSEEESNTDDEL